MRLCGLARLIVIVGIVGGVLPSREIHAASSRKMKIRGTSVSGQLYIPYKEFEKPFLLHASSRPQRPIPFSETHLSRVVYFYKEPGRGSRVFLMESTEGQNLIRDGVATRVILAELPVVKYHSNQGLVVSLKEMGRFFDHELFLESSTLEGPITSEARAGVKEILINYFLPTDSSSERVFLTQFAQLNQDTYYPTVEIRYVLEPLPERTSYQPIFSSHGRNVPFFKGARLAVPGRGSYHSPVFRWDVSEEHPIRVALSSKIPEIFRSAVRDGVLYWNRAFGYNAIEVTDAPEGITAPHPDYNLIEWVDFETAPFAYADLRSDPLTGEIRGGQLYLSSVWAERGRTRMREMLSQLQSDDLQHTYHDSLSKLPCKRNHMETVLNTLTTALNAGVSDEELEAISQDLIRSTTAHEMGHLLGLEHNFIGTTFERGRFSPFDLLNPWAPETSPVLTDRSRTANEVFPLTTVMHYPNFHEDILSGRQTEELEEALPYDAAAIRALYHEGDAHVCTHFHCADNGIGRYLDVNHRNTGHNPILSNVYEMHSALAYVPTALVEQILLARDETPLNELALDLERRVLKPFKAAWRRQMGWFSSDTESRVVEQTLGVRTPQRRREYQEHLFAWIEPFWREEEATVSSNVFPFLSSFVEEDPELEIRWQRHLRVLMQNSNLTEDEKTWAQEEALRLFQYIREFIPTFWVQSLSEGLNIRLESELFGMRVEGGPTENLERAIGRLVEGVLFSKRGSVDRFPYSVQIKALNLLLPSAFSSEFHWEHDARIRITRRLVQEIVQAKGENNLLFAQRQLQRREMLSRLNSSLCAEGFTKRP